MKIGRYIPPPPSPPPPWPASDPEIHSAIQLSTTHAHKVYFSGPLVEKLERLPDGSKSHDIGWTEVWAQLTGCTLSIWDITKVEEAAKQGSEVPPSYVHVSDAFVQVLGSLIVPATSTAPLIRYSNVVTLNNAGINIYLFSCPSPQVLLSLSAALRLAAWEKSRLEEIYTAHLLRVYLDAHIHEVPTPLVRGRKEGWARVRAAGRTDWTRVWLSIQLGANLAPSNPITKPKGLSAFFRREQPGQPAESTLFMFHSPKPKDRKKPLLRISNLSQAFAIYPERPDLITKSTLIKIEGTFGDDEMAGIFKSREAWVMLLPELENDRDTTHQMLQWVVALHDAFGLYGRPEAWSWDLREPHSLMFGCPNGPQKDDLFLRCEEAEMLDPREDRTSVVHPEMKDLMWKRMRPDAQDGSSGQPTALAPTTDGSDSYGTVVHPQVLPLPPGVSTDIVPESERPRTPRPEN